MREMPKPAGNMLAVAIFIFQISLFGLILQLTAPLAYGAQPAELPDLENGLKQSSSIWHVNSLEQSKGELMAKSPPTHEEINLEGNNTSAAVTDLKAFNSVKERDINCETQQNAEENDGQFVNSLDVSVSGSAGQAEEVWPGDPEIGDVEAIVDEAFGSGQPAGQEQLSGQGEIGESRSSKSGDRRDGRDLFSNNLDIDVHGITVSAVNTVEGGSAVATSNIIIKPVQMIVIPPEVEAKLK